MFYLSQTDHTTTTTYHHQHQKLNLTISDEKSLLLSLYKEVGSNLPKDRLDNSKFKKGALLVKLLSNLSINISDLGLVFFWQVQNFCTR